MKTKIEITSVSGQLLFEYEKEENTVKDTLMKAIESGANLCGANLCGAKDIPFVPTYLPEQEKSSDIDWEQRRFELAKATMAGIMGNCDKQLCQMEIPEIVKLTIVCADEMIKQLKEG